MVMLAIACEPATAAGDEVSPVYPSLMEKVVCSCEARYPHIWLDLMPTSMETPYDLDDRDLDSWFARNTPWLRIESTDGVLLHDLCAVLKEGPWADVSEHERAWSGDLRYRLRIVSAGTPELVVYGSPSGTCRYGMTLSCPGVFQKLAAKLLGSSRYAVE